MPSGKQNQPGQSSRRKVNMVRYHIKHERRVSREEIRWEKYVTQQKSGCMHATVEEDKEG